jgi:hypothetical protein
MKDDARRSARPPLVVREKSQGLTKDQADAYYETGVLPDRVKTWAAFRG